MITSVSIARRNTDFSRRLEKSTAAAPEAVLANNTRSNRQVRGDQLFKQLGDQSRDQFVATSDGTANDDVNATNPPGANVAKLVRSLRGRFFKAAANAKEFHAILKNSLGDNYNVEAAETIRQQSLDDDFGWMPNIEEVDAQTLSDSSGTQEDGVGAGAYSKQTDTIYISRQLVQKNPEKALQVLTEEAGHALDARLNNSDAAGDEVAARF